MVLFRDEILRSPISDHEERLLLGLLNHVILDQIQMERDGDVIDKHLIKSCVWMLEGLHEDDTEAEEQRLYNVSFEREYLESSRGFYKSESELLLRDSDAGAYCRYARRRIYEEDERCKQTLLDGTGPKIQKVVEDELIKNRIHELVEMESGVRYMIDNDRIEELNLVQFKGVSSIRALMSTTTPLLHRRLQPQLQFPQLILRIRPRKLYKRRASTSRQWPLSNGSRMFFP
jgi:cullin 3